MENKEFNIWQTLEVLAVRVRFIIGLVFIVTALSVVLAFVLPKWYKARTLLLPPKDTASRVGMVGRLSDALTLTSGLEQPIMATPADIYVRIVQSRSLTGRVIEKNQLRDYYGTESDDDIMEKIDEYSDIRVSDEGLIEISYLDKDPKMAAQVANSFAEELDVLNREISVSQAKGLREMIENRVAEVKAVLDSSRLNIEKFQQNNKAVDIDRQTQLAIESAVGLKVALAEAEIDLNVKLQTLSESHPTVVNLQRQIGEIKDQINRLEFGGPNSSYFNLPVSDVPGLKLEYAQLMADVKISEALYQLLQEQYEQVKIQERMKAPTIVVIDPAYVPEKPVKPRKSMIVLVAFVLSLVIAIFLALVVNYLEKLEISSPEDYRRARVFLGTFFFWLPGIKKKSTGA